METEIETIETKEADSRAVMTLEKVRTLKIGNNDAYVMAGHFRRAIKDGIKEIESQHDDNIRRWHEGHRKAISERDERLLPYMQAETILGLKILDYKREQDNLKTEEEERIRKELAKQEEERRLTEAIEAEAAGDKETAEELISAPIEIPPVILPKATPKLDRTAIKTYWKCEVIDMRALLLGVLNDSVPMQAIIPNMPLLGQIVRTLKKEMRYPGVKVWSEEGF